MVIRWKAVLIGAAAGLLSTVLAGLVLSLLVGALGASDPFSLGIVLGGVLGLMVAGFAAARFVFDHRPVNGSLAALLTAVVIGTDALLRGSGATALTLVGYSLLAALLGAAGGWFGSRIQQ